MTRRRQTMVRRAGMAVAAVALVASTSCLPVPDAVVAAACGPVVDSNDPSTWDDYISTPPGISDADWAKATETMGSIQALAGTALWSKIASVSFTSTFKIEVGVVGNIADVTAILEQWAKNPENLVVVDATSVVDLANQIVATIVADPELSAVDVGGDFYQVPFVDLRDARTVRVALPQNVRSGAYAKDLLNAHPDSILVMSGGKEVGPDGVGGSEGCLRQLPKWIVANGVPEGVSVSIKLDRSTVARGEAVTGALLVKNNRRSNVPVWSIGPSGCAAFGSQPVTTLDAQFAVNNTREGVEHGLFVTPLPGFNYFGGYSPSGGAVNPISDQPDYGACYGYEGFSEEIPPGGTAAIPFRADTFSMQPGSDVTLPPGRYNVRPLAFIFGFNLVALPPAEFTIA